ncbi:MAG: 30S ribosomal protein S12 methylthiotransferase RimO [Nitrospirae bacterium]|nr:30S ribosomal protein S12 methylthiotransferase RimO [Nitrospirota bacterium]MBI3605316.1 30S ribosomal protein S12 methylthiotransferase RimO [Nitrospirota bacterium]
MIKEKLRLYPKVGLINLGCAKNQVDSEVMLHKLQEAGFTLTPREEEAEIIIINTCGFIESAKRESIDMIIDLGKLKKKGQCKTLIATGCLTQLYQEELLKELPELDAIVGTTEYPKIADICKTFLDKKGKNKNRSSWLSEPTALYDESGIERVLTGERFWAYVKISEGCDKSCSFCIIPEMRGKMRSRPIPSIVKEVSGLARQGVREINLIAQDLTSYGRDMGKVQLYELLKELVDTDVDWIRILYNYPHPFPDKLMDLIAHEPKICNYIDMPLQHIDEEVLRKMNRIHQQEYTINLIKRMRDRIPNLVLRTSLIVGFPGESEKAFKTLYDFVKETRFDRLGVFIYSQEEGTPAGQMEDQIDEEVKQARWDKIMKLQEQISLKNHKKLVGTIQNVLISGLSKETDLLLEGRYYGQMPEGDGVVYINDGTASPGDMVKVEITDAHPYDLVGRIV